MKNYTMRRLSKSENILIQEHSMHNPDNVYYNYWCSEKRLNKFVCNRTIAIFKIKIKQNDNSNSN